MPRSSALWMAAGLLWVLDASINISMEPFRAFVADLLPDFQRTPGFAMQSLFIGLGAVVTSALPYLLTNVFHATTTAFARKIPFTVRLSFYIGATAFFGAVLWWPTRGRPTEARCELSGAADLYDDQRRSRGAGSCAQVAARLQDFPRPFFYDEITEGGYGEGADKEQEARTDAEYFTYLMMKLMDSTGSGQ